MRVLASVAAPRIDETVGFNDAELGAGALGPPSNPVKGREPAPRHHFDYVSRQSAKGRRFIVRRAPGAASTSRKASLSLLTPARMRSTGVDANPSTSSCLAAAIAATMTCATRNLAARLRLAALRPLQRAPAHGRATMRPRGAGTRCRSSVATCGSKPGFFPPAGRTLPIPAPAPDTFQPSVDWSSPRPSSNRRHCARPVPAVSHESGCQFARQFASSSNDPSVRRRSCRRWWINRNRARARVLAAADAKDWRSLLDRRLDEAGPPAAR